MAVADSTRACRFCGQANNRHGCAVYCSPKCKSMARRGKPTSKPTVLVACHGCGITQERPKCGRDAVLYCGRGCYFAAKTRVRLEAEALSRFAKHTVDAAAESARRERRAREAASRTERLNRQCVDCGNAFQQGTWLGRPEPRCAGCKAKAAASIHRTHKARRRALERGATADRIDPIAVFERDKWRCHLCGHKTLQSKRGSCHERAPELDHIVALADGGTHTWGNVACACRRCNGAKGARSIGQLGLSIAA